MEHWAFTRPRAFSLLLRLSMLSPQTPRTGSFFAMLGLKSPNGFIDRTSSPQKQKPYCSNMDIRCPSKNGRNSNLPLQLAYNERGKPRPPSRHGVDSWLGQSLGHRWKGMGMAKHIACTC